MWKNDRFFEERKVTFSAKIAATLLKSGKARIYTWNYSPRRTGGGARPAARPLRPASTAPNTAPIAAGGSPANRPPSV